MGNAASIFDCATNPLNPLPEEAASDEAERQIVLEESCPLRSSLLWRLQRAFYDDKGLQAWSDAIVPNFVTSNSFIARAYARVVLSQLQDVYGTGAERNAVADYAQPVYVIELGAGHGKLGYLIIEGLLRYRAFFPRTDCPWPFKYVLTDAARRDVDAWLEHPNLKEFIELGVLDVAVFDAERDTEMTLLKSGVTLKPGGVFNPACVIANYVFDSLTTDAFRIEAGVLQQALLTLTVPSQALAPQVVPPVAAAADTGAVTAAVHTGVTVPVQLPPAADVPGVEPAAAASAAAAAAKKAAAATTARPPRTVAVPPSVIGKWQLGWTYKPLAPAPAAGSSAAAGAAAVYGSPVLDGLLAAYAATPSLRQAASVLMPVGALAAVQSLLNLCGGRLVLLAGDKGYGRCSEMEGLRDPHLAVHGSLSFMVNMHALRQAARAYGGFAMQTPYYEGFKVAAYFFGSPEESPVAGGAAIRPLNPAAPIRTATPHGGFSDVEDEADVGIECAIGAPSYAAALAALSAAPAADGAPTVAQQHPHHPQQQQQPYRRTRWAVADGLTRGLTADDFSTLQRCVREECADPSLKLVLALLRLANHDADVFHKFKQVLIDKVPAAPADTVQRDVRSDVDRLFAAYYPLQRGKDTCFECGRVLMGVRDYAAAVDFFARSNELCGEHHVTMHNMGICYFYMEDFDSALDCFKASLALRPDYAEARIWWSKASARVAALRDPEGYAAGDGYGDSDGAAGTGDEGAAGHSRGSGTGLGASFGPEGRLGDGGGSGDEEARGATTEGGSGEGTPPRPDGAHSG